MSKNIRNELNRRLYEVDWFQRIELINQDKTLGFFTAIADYINYVQSQKKLLRYCNDLKELRAKLNIDKDLVKEGDTITKKIIADYKKIIEEIEKANIAIPSYEEAFPATFSAGSLSNKQALALNKAQLDNFVKQENKYVGDIPKIIGEIWSMIGSAKSEGLQSTDVDAISDSYHKIRAEYEKKLRLQKNLISFLRYNDYEKLYDVWENFYADKDNQIFSPLRFHLGDVLDEGTYYPSFSQEKIREVGKMKEQYLFSIHRLHNFIEDKFDEISRLKGAGIWLWDNFGKSIVSLMILAIVLIVLKYLGITYPIEKIMELFRL